MQQPSAGTPLDEAWDEANAVMPGAWRVQSVIDLMIGPPNDHVAKAVSVGRLGAGTLHGYGDSPTGALNDLTRNLRVLRDGAP